MKLIIKLLLIIFSWVFLSGCYFQKEKAKVTVFSKEEAAQAALDFIEERSETYKFDGIKNTLKVEEVQALRCPGCFVVIVSFDSAQGGYGNRTGQVLIQVVTPHKARIEFYQGEVKSAVLDGIWDILKQEKITNE